MTHSGDGQSSGWIKLWRKIGDSSLMQDSRALQLFVYFLLHANNEPASKSTLFNGEQYYLKPGEVVFGRHAIAEKLCQSPSSIRNALDRLKRDRRVDIKSDNKKSIVSICNWFKYQAREDSKQDSDRTTRGQQQDTIQEVKNKELRSKNTYVEQVDSILSFFNEITHRNLKPTRERKELIARRLKDGHTVDDLKKAILHFSLDEWPERYKFVDLVYAIGMRKGVDYVDKWINAVPTSQLVEIKDAKGQVIATITKQEAKEKYGIN